MGVRWRSDLSHQENGSLKRFIRCDPEGVPSLVQDMVYHPFSGIMAVRLITGKLCFFPADGLIPGEIINDTLTNWQYWNAEIVINNIIQHEGLDNL